MTWDPGLNGRMLYKGHYWVHLTVDGKLGEGINVKFPETVYYAVVMKQQFYFQKMHTEFGVDKQMYDNLLANVLAKCLYIQREE